MPRNDLAVAGGSLWGAEAGRDTSGHLKRVEDS